ncbi:MAG: PQQ-dependent dehydrogenase, methanol/ethanol family, partial [Gemmatimonadaceae bacterium]
MCLAAALAALLLGAAGCASEQGSAANAAPRSRDLDDLVRDDGQWAMPAKNYASTRYSTLAEITTANVKDLRLAWTFSTGIRRGHEGAPLVIGSTMYVVSPFPNTLYALDLTKSGAMKWKYQPPYIRAANGVACCDVVNRGLAYYDGALFFNTLDNQVVS